MILHPSVVAWAVSKNCETLQRSKKILQAECVTTASRRSISRIYNEFIKEEKEGNHIFDFLGYLIDDANVSNAIETNKGSVL